MDDEYQKVMSEQINDLTKATHDGLKI